MSGTASAEPLEALQVITALRRFGWHQESSRPGLYEAWIPAEDDPVPSIVVPLDPSKGDYEHLLSRARRSLVEAIGAEADRFLGQLHERMNAALDITRFAKETAAAFGSISWRQGKTLIESAEKSLIAAAKSSGEVRRYHGNSSANIAREFLDATLMGQTEVGSFVVRAFTPSRERFYLSSSVARREGQMPDVAARTGRQIIATLERSVKTTRDVLDEYVTARRVELFVDAVAEGVSFELVNALADFSRDSEHATVIIDYAVRSGEPSQEVTIDFSATDAPMLDRAATHLVAERPSQEMTLRGRVEMLRGRSVEDAGLVALNVVDNPRISILRVRLSSEDFERAYHAYGQNEVMVVTGRIERDGQYFWMYEPSDIDFEQSRTGSEERQLDMDITTDADRTSES